MRAAFLVLLAILALAVTANPSGNYCGSYMGMVTGKVDFGKNTIDVNLDVFNSKSNCPNVYYQFNAVTNIITIPSASDKADCLGKLISSNGLKLDATYNPSANSISLDVGIATIDMTSC